MATLRTALIDRCRVLRTVATSADRVEGRTPLAEVADDEWVPVRLVVGEAREAPDRPGGRLAAVVRATMIGGPGLADAGLKDRVEVEQRGGTTSTWRVVAMPELLETRHRRIGVLVQLERVVEPARRSLFG